MTKPPTDQDTTFKSLKDEIESFIHEREWEQFHSPKNLSMALAIEAAELMDIFKWHSSDEAWELVDDEKVRRDVEDELADIIVYGLAFANRHNIDVSSAIRRKMVKNGRKYPRSEFRGKF